MVLKPCWGVGGKDGGNNEERPEGQGVRAVEAETFAVVTLAVDDINHVLNKRKMGRRDVLQSHDRLAASAFHCLAGTGFLSQRLYRVAVMCETEARLADRREPRSPSHLEARSADKAVYPIRPILSWEKYTSTGPHDLCPTRP